MCLIAWNCRGLGNPLTVQVLVDMVHSKRPILVFLMETLSTNSRMSYIKNKLGFKGVFTVDSLGRNGGLALLWREEVQVHINSYSRNHIDAKVSVDERSMHWRFTGFYGHPKRNKKARFLVSSSTSCFLELNSVDSDG